MPQRRRGYSAGMDRQQTKFRLIFWLLVSLGAAAPFVAALAARFLLIKMIGGCFVM
jgi:hypothetical protein